VKSCFSSMLAYRGEKGKMVELNKETKQLDNEEHSESQLKGTFASVLILGGFILGCWLFVFILFMIRNGG
jgi:hypothetical protein